MESSDIPEGRGEGDENSALSDAFCLNRFQAPPWPVSTLSALAYMGPSRAPQAASDLSLCLLSKTPCPHCPPKPSSGCGSCSISIPSENLPDRPHSWAVARGLSPPFLSCPCPVPDLFQTQKHTLPL